MTDKNSEGISKRGKLCNVSGIDIHIQTSTKVINPQQCNNN
ncbi:MAG: hypothetical protein ACJ72Q_00965 [Nitrososphaeraceae archaeon]